MSPQKPDWVGRRHEIILLKRYELDASLFHAAEGDGTSTSTGWYPLELFGSTCSLFSPQRHAARDPLREISLPRFGHTVQCDDTPVGIDIDARKIRQVVSRQLPLNQPRE